MPDDRIVLAARNNAEWIDAVCRAHGLVGSFDDSAWTAPTRTPPYHPDAVTLAPGVDPEELLAMIDGSDGASVKDSFSDVDLYSADFVRLVIGDWLWVAPGVTSLTVDRSWTRVDSRDLFEAWVRAWALDPEDLPILHPALLDVPGVTFLAEFGGDGTVLRGCSVFRTGAGASEVASLNTVFDRRGPEATTTLPGGASPEADLWAWAIAAARATVGQVPLVGWEAGDGSTAAQRAGAETIGELTVWMR